MNTNVSLRDVRDSDLEIFFEQQSDPGANHMAAFMPRNPTNRDAFDAHWAKIRADDTVTIRTIVFDDHLAGNVGSFMRDGKREVCYWLGEAYWGKGIASSALSQFVTLLDDRPLYAGVAKDNLASIRVLQKCGFALVAKTKSFAKARGKEIDELVMRLD